MIEGKRVHLDGTDGVRLVTSLARAHVIPFDHSDWSGWAGATGEAHMVHFYKPDLRYLLQALEVPHWSASEVTVILDDLGVTFNHTDHAGFAYQICMKMTTDCYDVDEAPAPQHDPEEVLAVFVEPADRGHRLRLILTDTDVTSNPDSGFYDPAEAGRHARALYKRARVYRLEPGRISRTVMPSTFTIPHRVYELCPTSGTPDFYALWVDGEPVTLTRHASVVAAREHARKECCNVPE